MRKWLFAVISICISQVVWSANKELRFMWWGGGDRHEATMRVIKQYELKNPGIKIKWDYVKSGGVTYYDKIKRETEAGKEADILQINWAYIDEASRDGEGFVDLKNYKFIKLDDFINESWTSGLSNNKLNGLPMAYTARMFIWNKTTWQKAGLPLPKTWDDLFAAAKVFEQKLGKNAYPMDAQHYDRILLSHAYIFQKFGKPWLEPKQPKVALNEAEALEWLRFFKRLTAERVIPSREERTKTGGGLDLVPEQHPSWVSGLWGGNYTWDSRFRILTSTPKGFEFAAGNFLTMPGAKNSGVFGRPAMMVAIGKHSKYPEEAARFINYITTDPAAAKVLGMTRGTPMSKSQIDYLTKSKDLAGLELEAKNILETTKVDLPSPLIENSEVGKWLRDVFAQYEDGTLTEQDAARKLVQDTNTMLAKQKK